MQANAPVLRYAVVEAARFPAIGEERHGDRLAEIVELEASGTDSIHDGGVVDGLGGDRELAGAEKEIRVCRCAAQSAKLALKTKSKLRRRRRRRQHIPKGIANHQESHIVPVRVG